MTVFVPAPAPGLGYGGSEYGYSPYGSPVVPTQPYTVSGGYGGSPYGYSSYGSIDSQPPRVNSAVSISGFAIEVFFSEPMQNNAALTDPSGYVLTDVLGAPCTIDTITLGTPESDGYTSVILNHTGTTLGGRYSVEVPITLRDMADNLILPTARTVFLYTLGTNPTYTVSPIAGNLIEIVFSEDMLVSSGILDVDAYGIETAYPVSLTVLGVGHPVSGDAARVRLEVEGMTSASYDITIAPAEAVAYDGSYLPNTATSFTGVEIGTGSSTAGSSGLLLSKSAAVSYGWSFEDTSGRVLPNSTYRVDVTFNAAAAVFDPPLYDTNMGAITVSDGAVQASLTFNRVGGMEVIDIASGSYFAQVPVAWSTGEITVSVVLNQQAALYSVLIDGVPVVSAPSGDWDGVPTISPGVSFVLDPAYDVTQFPLTNVGFTATQTVFTNTWNFLHGVTSVFTGSSALTRPHLLTKRGPLVKDWGDPTPATIQDVEVRVNGTPVDITAVNPYLGLITPTIPIPLTSPGSTSVDVDYTWFPNPAMPMQGLNYPGLVLNKWDMHQGWNPPAVSPSPSGHLGAADRMRFPMGIVLPPLQRQRPIQIGHRYLGFEKAYTSALNSPTTLLLNQSPHKIARDTLSKSPQNVSKSYEGTASPLVGSEPWDGWGNDTGYVGANGETGYYILVDDTTNRFGEGEGAYYVRQEDFSFPASTILSARLQVQDWTPDGIFSGIGFGAHNNRHLFLVGLLEINGVQHVGILKHAAKPHLVSSWAIGPALPLTITSENTFTTTASAFATTASRIAGLRIQILEGPQAGTYTVAECGVSIDGDLATVTIDSSFPSDPSLWGNNTATAYVEVPWGSRAYTYRLVANMDTGYAEVYVGGAYSGLAISIPRVATYPAQTTLLLHTSQQGSVFWGSLSRMAQNQSLWAFVRYGITYDAATYHFQGIVVAAEMSDVPEDDANHEWFITEDFGYSLIDSTGDTLLLKATATNTENLDTSFGYGRLEPFLTSQVLVDVDATLRIDSGTRAQIQIQNGERKVVFSTLLYREENNDPTFERFLSPLSAISITGIRDPLEDGWAPTGTGTIEVLEQNIVLTQTPSNAIRYTASFPGVNTGDGNGRVIEGRFAVLSHGTLSSANGPFISGTVADYPAAGVHTEVGLVLQTTDVVRFVSGDTLVGTPVSFTWDDGEMHTYRLLADTDAGAVVLVVDDQVLASTPLTGFTSTNDTYTGRFGSRGDASSVVEWESISVQALPRLDCKRTIGVFVGTDPDDIDHWEIPRTDSTNAPNSVSNMAVVEEMDWRSDIQVRVRLDPAWGVTVFRPDLPPPPYFTGDFATQFTEPSAGWINAEYNRLLRTVTPQTFGRVQFGALDPLSISQQRWGEVRYRIYTRGDEDFIAPQHMVLNRANVITSGEMLRDVTPEVVVVDSITTTLVSLVPSHIYADRVFNITVNGTVLNPTDWSFDKDTQSILLASPLPEAHTSVTVTFAAGKPVTNTYLCSQPLLQSTTLLNEGTPPVPKSQIGPATREIVFGSALNDPTDTLGSPDYILNDQYRSVTFTDDSNLLYEDLEFCEVDDGNARNLLSIACDGPSPEIGWIEMALSGTAFSDAWSLPGGPKIWKGSAAATDTVGGFSQTSILHASGNGYDGGHLGPGTAVMYPSYPAIPGPDQGAVVRSMHMRMSWQAVLTDPNTEQALEEDLDVPCTWGDNTPASEAGDSVALNPDGTPSLTGNGACVSVMTDYASTTYSRLGPWAGETALAVRSQLSGNGYPLSGSGLVLAGGFSLGAPPTPVALTIEAAN